MRKLIKKLASKKGETLVEILVAVLIVALAASLFAAMYSASASINTNTKKQDDLFYEAVGNLESMSGETSEGKVHYKSKDKDGNEFTDDVDVEIYTEDGMTAYKNKDKSSGGGD